MYMSLLRLQCQLSSCYMLPQCRCGCQDDIHVHKLLALSQNNAHWPQPSNSNRDFPSELHNANPRSSQSHMPHVSDTSGPSMVPFLASSMLLQFSQTHTSPPSPTSLMTHQHAVLRSVSTALGVEDSQPRRRKVVPLARNAAMRLPSTQALSAASLSTVPTPTSKASETPAVLTTPQTVGCHENGCALTATGRVRSSAADSSSLCGIGGTSPHTPSVATDAPRAAQYVSSTPLPPALLPLQAVRVSAACAPSGCPPTPSGHQHSRTPPASAAARAMPPPLPLRMLPPLLPAASPLVCVPRAWATLLGAMETASVPPLLPLPSSSGLLLQLPEETLLALCGARMRLLSAVDAEAFREQRAAMQGRQGPERGTGGPEQRTSASVSEGRPPGGRTPTTGEGMPGSTLAAEGHTLRRRAAFAAVPPSASVSTGVGASDDVAGGRDRDHAQPAPQPPTQGYTAGVALQTGMDAPVGPLKRARDAGNASLGCSEDVISRAEDSLLRDAASKRRRVGVSTDEGASVCPAEESIGVGAPRVRRSLGDAAGLGGGAAESDAEEEHGQEHTGSGVGAAATAEAFVNDDMDDPCGFLRSCLDAQATSLRLPPPTSIDALATRRLRGLHAEYIRALGACAGQLRYLLAVPVRELARWECAVVTGWCAHRETAASTTPAASRVAPTASLAAHDQWWGRTSLLVLLDALSQALVCACLCADEGRAGWWRQQELRELRWRVSALGDTACLALCRAHALPVQPVRLLAMHSRPLLQKLAAAPSPSHSDIMRAYAAAEDSLSAVAPTATLTHTLVPDCGGTALGPSNLVTGDAGARGSGAEVGARAGRRASGRGLRAAMAGLQALAARVSGAEDVLGPQTGAVNESVRTSSRVNSAAACPISQPPQSRRRTREWEWWREAEREGGSVWTRAGTEDWLRVCARALGDAAQGTPSTELPASLPKDASLRVERGCARGGVGWSRAELEGLIASNTQDAGAASAATSRLCQPPAARAPLPITWAGPSTPAAADASTGDVLVVWGARARSVLRGLWAAEEDRVQRRISGEARAGGAGYAGAGAGAVPAMLWQMVVSAAGTAGEDGWVASELGSAARVPGAEAGLVLCAVPFARAAPLLLRRECMCVGGRALLPLRVLNDVVLEGAREALARAAVKVARLAANRHATPLVPPSLAPLTLSLYSPLPDPHALPTAALAALALAVAEDLQLARAAASFPPCMWRLLRELDTRGHVKFHARLQLNLFLKDAGLPLAEAAAFWRQALRLPEKRSSWSKYEYMVRHNYGKAGSCKEYHGAACAKLQGPQSEGVHGCPFVRLRRQELDALLAQQVLAASAAPTRPRTSTRRPHVLVELEPDQGEPARPSLPPTPLGPSALLRIVALAEQQRPSQACRQFLLEMRPHVFPSSQADKRAVGGNGAAAAHAAAPAVSGEESLCLGAGAGEVDMEDLCGLAHGPTVNPVQWYVAARLCETGALVPRFEL